jgi:hypothetical protein
LSDGNAGRLLRSGARGELAAQPRFPLAERSDRYVMPFRELGVRKAMSRQIIEEIELALRELLNVLEEGFEGIEEWWAFAAE